MVRLLLVSGLATLAVVGSQGGSAEAAQPLRVVQVYPPNPPHLIARQYAAGYRRAERELGVDVEIVVAPIRTTLSSTIRALARNHDLVVGTGDFLGSILETARSFPETTFAVKDAPSSRVAWPENVAGVATRDEEIGFVVGYLGGLVEHRRPGRDVVASVGGTKAWTVDRYIAGYQAGARLASPGVRTLNEYSNNFGDAETCRRVAQALVARGAGVLFNVARDCGLGTLAAAERAGVWGIGVDQDQSSFGPHILTSAVNRSDVVVYRIVKRFASGRLALGGVTEFGLRDGALGLGKVSRVVPRSLVQRSLAIERQIEIGLITAIPTSVP